MGFSFWYKGVACINIDKMKNEMNVVFKYFYASFLAW